MRESSNPCNFAFEDCDRVLSRTGFVLAKNSGTSHRKYVLKRAGLPTVIIGILHPGSGHVARWYVEDMLAELEKHHLFPEGDRDATE